MKKYILFVLPLIFFHQVSGDTLEIEINNIAKPGILHLGVYDSKKVFESDRGDKPGPQPGIVAGIVKKVSKGVFKEEIEVPSGTYAIGLYIDANENEKMDTNFLGIPKEQYGTSNNLLFLDFEAASFVINTYEKVQIDL